jgi:hypothetical protein
MGGYGLIENFQKKDKKIKFSVYSSNNGNLRCFLKEIGDRDSLHRGGFFKLCLAAKRCKDDFELAREVIIEGGVNFWSVETVANAS